MTDPYGPPPQDPYAPQPPQAPTNPYAQTPPPASVPPVSPSPATPPYGQPQYSPAPYGTPQYGQQSPYGYPVAAPQNSLALVSMILSLVGILSWITAPVGAILGHVAMKQIRQTGESGEGMAKTGIIVGWIITGLGVLCCVGYIALIVAGVWSAETNNFD
ncbi:hypothetical protein Rhe02_97480 [Rhizocola hellebori]|uniref:DUF4190 domain-containing protein n=1 Tax=Rhizocola hellebori TaxID=1392758 RepID=A0A8J3VMS8_9ACTN|nr:DUF4190 domain-containing protein [Rhizocola hellebori]GIH11681.1 hypothetical protein Rhe02_97480 [Rhizocola hellebori]